LKHPPPRTKFLGTPLIPKTVFYTATSSRSFLLSQEVRFAWRVVVKSSSISASSICGAVFHTISSVQQNAPRLCTSLITHQLTDNSQLKHLFAYLWCVLYYHPTCVTVSKYMAGRVITIRYLKCLWVTCMIIYPVMYIGTFVFRAPLVLLQTLRAYYIFYRGSKSFVKNFHAIFVLNNSISVFLLQQFMLVI
jgi:hypothetical protein